MSTQHSLFDFDGETYEKQLDRHRLSGQFMRVRRLVLESYPLWFTLRELSDALGYPEASISARLRDLRKPRFGEHDVQRRRRGAGKRGQFEYRVLP